MTDPPTPVYGRVRPGAYWCTMEGQPMTVAELIALLQTMPPDTTVQVLSDDGRSIDASGVTFNRDDQTVWID